MNESSSSPKGILYQASSLQGSRDNMSIIIIAFPAAPKATSEAIKAENELNDLLKQKVTGKVDLLIIKERSQSLRIPLLDSRYCEGERERRRHGVRVPASKRRLHSGAASGRRTVRKVR